MLALRCTVSAFSKFYCQFSTKSTQGYVGSDYPRLWPIPASKPVGMYIEDSTHYQMEGANADREWDALTPGDGLIYLGEKRQPFSISMFHQLRCLNIFRRHLVAVHSPNASAEAPSAELSRHCLNYLRQMIHCRSDLRLDALLGPDVQAFPDLYECRNWDTVYADVNANQMVHSR